MWDWIDDAVGLVGDYWDTGVDYVSDYWDTGVDYVDDWFTGTEGIDTPFTDDLLAPAVKAGSQLIGPRTESGSFYDGLFGTDFKLKDALGWGQDIYGAYRQGDLADAQAESYAPLLGLFGTASQAMTPYTDPTQRAALQSQEEQRITDLMTPFVERAAYRGRASDLSQGVGDSSIADWRDQERQRAAAELVQDYVVPTASQNVASAGADLQNLYTGQLGMLTEQPTMIQKQATAQQKADPWSNIFLGI